MVALKGRPVAKNKSVTDNHEREVQCFPTQNPTVHPLVWCAWDFSFYDLCSEIGFGVVNALGITHENEYLVIMVINDKKFTIIIFYQKL